MDTVFGLYFHFCLELALETLAKASLSNSLGVHDPDHTHSLAGIQCSCIYLCHLSSDSNSIICFLVYHISTINQWHTLASQKKLATLSSA